MTKSILCYFIPDRDILDTEFKQRTRIETTGNSGNEQDFNGPEVPLLIITWLDLTPPSGN